MWKMLTMVVIAAGIAGGAVDGRHDGGNGTRIIDVEGTLEIAVIHGGDRCGWIDVGVYGEGGRRGEGRGEGRRRRGKESFE